MRRGFTLIEIIVSLMILSIVLGILLNGNYSIYNTNALTKNRDVEFNLARSICEKFRSETGVIQSKTIVFYLDNVSELPFSISDSINDRGNETITDYGTLINNNLLDKSFAAVLEGNESEYIYILRVKVISMLRWDSGVVLRIAR